MAGYKMYFHYQFRHVWKDTSIGVYQEWFPFSSSSCGFAHIALAYQTVWKLNILFIKKKISIYYLYTTASTKILYMKSM